MAHNSGLLQNQSWSTLEYSGLLFPATWLARLLLVDFSHVLRPAISPWFMSLVVRFALRATRVTLTDERLQISTRRKQALSTKFCSQRLLFRMVASKCPHENGLKYRQSEYKQFQDGNARSKSLVTPASVGLAREAIPLKRPPARSTRT